MLAKLFGRTTRRDFLLRASHRPNADTAAVVTLAAVTDLEHVVHNIQWSYSDAPTGGKLTITVAAVIVWEVDITAAGPGGFGMPIAGDDNEAVVITLAAGGGSVVGKLNVQYTTEPTRSR